MWEPGRGGSASLGKITGLRQYRGNMGHPLDDPGKRTHSFWKAIKCLQPEKRYQMQKSLLIKIFQI